MDADHAASMWTGLAAGLLLTLHFLLYPVWAGMPAGPNLLAGGLLLAALRLRAGPAAGLGFVLGLLESGMTLDGLGGYALVLTLVGYAAARSRDILFADARYYVFIYLVAGTWLAEVALHLVEPGVESLGRALAAGASAAILTGVVGAACEAAAVSIAMGRST